MYILIIEISSLLLGLFSLGFMKTFNGKTIVELLLASVIIIFNYFSMKQVIQEWDLYTFILNLSSLFLVLFVFSKIVSPSNEESESDFKTSGLSLLFVFVILVLGFFY